MSLFDYFVELALKRLLFLQPLTLSENGLRGGSFLRNILKFFTATPFKTICCWYFEDTFNLFHAIDFEKNELKTLKSRLFFIFPERVI